MSFQAETPSTAYEGLLPETEPSAAAKAIMSRTSDLAVLPHVVFKVLELSGSADNAASEMERAITVDPGFSAKLLTYANSSFYAVARKVTSIRDAIVYLGYKSVREMAMTIGVFDMFVGKNDKESLRRRAWWRQSVDCAIACKCLAEMTKKVDSAEAYTCGLLHLIGKSLLDRFGEHDYEQVEQRLAVGAAEKSAEQRVYGCDHEELAVEAGKKWGLPANVISSFRCSEKPTRLDDSVKYIACVALATQIARMAVGHGSGECLPQWALEELEIPLTSAQEVYDQIVERIAAVNTMQI